MPKSDGMNYAPQGYFNAVCRLGEFVAVPRLTGAQDERAVSAPACGIGAA